MTYDHTEQVYQHDMLPVPDGEVTALELGFVLYDRIIYRAMIAGMMFMMRDN